MRTGARETPAIAVLLWSGLYGGAETWSLALTRAFRKEGLSAGLLFVGRPGPIVEAARGEDIPCECLGCSRGAEVLLRPRELARAATRIGRDAVIAPSAGYLSAALRLGGYSGRIVAVEHGSLLQHRRLPWPVRVLRMADLWSGLWAVDAQVTPSDFMMRELAAFPHKAPMVRIHHGLELERHQPSDLAESRDRGMVVGFAGRLIQGKGIGTLLHAVAELARDSVKLEIAGDGPERKSLEALAAKLGIADRVRFRGWVHDMSTFWRSCDVAVVPSEEWIESFGMVVIEAMAAGLPILATRSGALPELVVDGETGALFRPGRSDELVALLSAYAGNFELRRRHGAASLERCHALFSITECARRYRRLITDLIGGNGIGELGWSRT
jgi:glycosyltransferase involved in cell wall biosynthesis